MADLPAFLEREKHTVQHIRDQAAKIGRLNELYESAAKAFARVREDVGMNVILRWPVIHESGGGRLLWLYVGGLIECCDGVMNASYSLCVVADAQEDGRKRVLRKYHFDFADPAGRRTRPHPVFHLQYAGTFSPESESELDDEHMDGWLEEPRVFFGPVSLALVLHMAFREFPDEYTERLRKDGHWTRTILRRDQECIWRPFYEQCVSLIDNHKIVLDEAYGA